MERDGTTTPKQQSELEMPPGNYSCWGKAAISESFFTPLPRFCRKSGRGGGKSRLLLASCRSQQTPLWAARRVTTAPDFLLQANLEVRKAEKPSS